MKFSSSDIVGGDEPCCGVGLAIVSYKLLLFFFVTKGSFLDKVINELTADVGNYENVPKTKVYFISICDMNHADVGTRASCKVHK